ncbi:MAG: BON domain-containing protein [Vicinamibacterales bacterium]
MNKTICGAIAIAAFTVLSVSAPRAMQAPADNTLKERIEYRLETTPTVRKYDLKVKVDQGIATLSGDVATAAQKADAERLAHVDGVKRVESNITVNRDADKTVADRVKGGFTKTGEKISDAWITTKVKWFFVGDDLLKGSDINVDTKDNVVTLKGTVKSAAGRARAVELAQTTDGVKRVVDNLVIRSTDR